MKKWVGTVIVALLIIGGLIQTIRPLPGLVVALGATEEKVPGTVHLSLPPVGESAVLAAGLGVLAATPNETPVPIASVTKMMTAYVVLKRHPLQMGQSGPSIAITAKDVATYKKDVANGDSVLPVVAGETLTERQLIEGLMLPSGDNAATILADWVDGSEDKFVQEMNQTAKFLGMNQTRYADASGVNPKSQSTPLDQLKLAEVDMQNPVFQAIVAEREATLPGAGTIYNVDDSVLGKDGIVGVKTGSTPQAGGCFISAKWVTLKGHKILLLGAVMGQKGSTYGLWNALDASVKLLNQAAPNLQVEASPFLGQSAGTLQSAWGERASLTTDRPIQFVGYPGMTVRVSTNGQRPISTPVEKGAQVASLEIQAGDQTKQYELESRQPITNPSFIWRLFR